MLASPFCPLLLYHPHLFSLALSCWGSSQNSLFIAIVLAEQLQEPQVTIQSVNVFENASCTITLVCSVEGAGGDVQYKWTSRDPHASESWGDPTLIISWLPCDADLPYTCTAKNPVSQSSSYPVHVSQFCTGNWFQ